jgi:hypothetical protein
VSQPVLQAAQLLRDALAGFDPAVLSGADCARAVEELALTEKACGAARALAAARAGGAGRTGSGATATRPTGWRL